jgi:hypothetical protein
VQENVTKLPTPPASVSPPVGVAEDVFVDDGIELIAPTTPWTGLNNEDANGLFQVHQTEEELADEVTQALIMDFLSIPPDDASNVATEAPNTQLIAPLSQTTLTSPTQLRSDFTSHILLEQELQALEVSQYTFSDDALLEVPSLKAMQAGMNIATLLGCATSIWDPSALRTFTLSCLPDPNITLPSNLAPTDAQRLIPHHPILDMFPWPSMRTRLICVFAQPPHMRPVSAREPDALLKLGMDMDDDAEGMRVSGEEWYDGENWEVGEVIYRNWWWCLDRNIIENSNRLRRKRGAPRLMLCGEETG